MRLRYAKRPGESDGGACGCLGFLFLIGIALIGWYLCTVAAHDYCKGKPNADPRGETPTASIPAANRPAPRPRR